MKAIHVIQRWLAVVIVAAVAAQFLLAGAGAFGATSFKPHTAIGWTTAVLSLIALVLAVTGRGAVRASAVLLVAVAAQVALGVLGENSSAWFGAAHGLNALVVTGAAVDLARRTTIPNRPVSHTHLAPTDS